MANPAAPLIVKRITPILGLVALLAAYHIAGGIWGRTAKFYTLVGMLLLYAALAAALFFSRRQLQRERPDLAGILDSAPVSPWYWKLLDAVFGVIFAFVPPVLVSLALGQPLSWESEFTGYHVLAMAGGVGIYWLGRAYAVKRWRQRNGVTKESTD
jgi:hypothetical protein